MIEAQINEAVTMWSNGVLLREIADRIGVSERRLTRCMRANRPMFPMRFRGKMPDDQTELVAELWSQRKTSKEIAQTVGCSVRQVRKLIFERAAILSTGRARRYYETPIQKTMNMEAFCARDGVMLFTTSTGYQCPMPRVSILEKAG